MNIEEIKQYFLDKKGAEETYPFNMQVPVFKVGGKMFALINVHEDEESINLKYNKDEIQMLRSSFEGIVPGYHMNKSHWNTLYISKLEDSLIKELIDISYNLVYKSLTKAVKLKIEEEQNLS